MSPVGYLEIGVCPVRLFGDCLSLVRLFGVRCVSGKVIWRQMCFW